MTNEISFAALKKEYQGSKEKLVVITDRKDALNMIESKTSCCWGAGHKMGDTGWIQLASPSRRWNEKKRTIFVCRESLVK